MRSSQIYEMCPVWLRENGFEVNRMSRCNCFSFKPHPHSSLPLQERQAHYDDLVEDIRRVGVLRTPIRIALNRGDFGRDKIIDGHHRLNIAIDLGHGSVPVIFEYGQKRS